MRSGVFQQFNLVVGAPDDPACSNDNCADRHFTSLVSFFRLPQRFAHEILIAQCINHLLVVATPCGPSTFSLPGYLITRSFTGRWLQHAALAPEVSSAY